MNRRRDVNWPLIGATRFFLALVVLAYHLSWFTSDGGIITKLSKFSPLVAVLGFLVRSGFSIAASYESNSKGFYFRRCLRILPIYFASISATIYITIIKNDPTLMWNDFGWTALGHLFFLQGIVVGSLSENAVLWTLTIEMFFYLLTPLVRNKVDVILPIVLTSLALFILQRYMTVPYYSYMQYGMNIAFLGWTWLLGFWFFHNRHNSEAPFILLGAGVLGITINGFFASDFAMITWLLTCIVISYGQHFKLGFSKILTFLGDVSYPMYVFHMPIFALITFYTDLDVGVLLVLFVIIMSAFMDSFFDKPIKIMIRQAHNRNKFKDR